MSPFGRLHASKRQATQSKVIAPMHRFCENRKMLLDFFYHLRQRGLKPNTREFLTLLEALKADVISPLIDDFYFLSNATLVKDEGKFDRFYFCVRGILQGRRRTG